MDNIRDREKFAERLWDWGFLNECWGGKIRPSDIDGIVERNGYFLILEGKPANQEPNKGQQILLQMLTKKIETCTALILYGEPGDPKFYRRVSNGNICDKKPCGKRDIIAICKAWFNAVDSKRKK